MEEIERNLRTARLIDFYGELLTEHQKEVLVDYFFKNLSLAEIGESNGTSRQAVSESISKSVKKLERFEEIVGSLKMYDKLYMLKEHAEKIDNKYLSNEINKILENFNGSF